MCGCFSPYTTLLPLLLPLLFYYFFPTHSYLLAGIRCKITPTTIATSQVKESACQGVAEGCANVSGRKVKQQQRQQRAPECMLLQVEETF
ncbi:unnamed protein product [Ceratitis capitata]|uniref:(Mediterranean fruit fly) hypothetical protein n=1 Tax=Ceratitis capitata TaxID=7213 RepID=A0A811VC04_CERCA|nr:unnamed protein product [Ceratitis capitata]